MRFRFQVVRPLAVAGVLFVLGVSAVQAQAPASQVPAAQFGEPFPALKVTLMNPPAGRPATVDLAAVLGKRPVVLVYWIAGHPRSEELLREIEQRFAGSMPERMAMFGVVTERPGREAAAIRARIAELGIKSPQINDEGFRLDQMLKVSSVPSVVIIDREGRLRLSNGASLKQPVEYKLDLGGVLERLAKTGQAGTHGPLPRYYPVNELVGQKCPDFQAAELQSGVMRRWYSLLEPNQVNVLLFWSVDCPHCRKTLPELNDWLKRNAPGINVVTAARVNDATMKQRTRDYCKFNKFVFPTLIDEEQAVAQLFQVTATPTILIVRPDGVIDSVLMHEDFAPAFEAARKSLLKTSS